MPTGFTLWGFHPAYVGKAGAPYLLRLAVGSSAACEVEARYRRGIGGWTLGVYRTGDEPAGVAAILSEHLAGRA